MTAREREGGGTMDAPWQNHCAALWVGRISPRDGRWLRLGAWVDGDKARIAPFEAIEIEISSLFPPTGSGERA